MAKSIFQRAKLMCSTSWLVKIYNKLVTSKWLSIHLWWPSSSKELVLLSELSSFAPAFQLCCKSPCWKIVLYHAYQLFPFSKARPNRSLTHMVERAPRDWKFPSLNPTLDPLRRVSNIIRNDDYNVIMNSHNVWCIV